jgi:hypothetical protein
VHVQGFLIGDIRQNVTIMLADDKSDNGDSRRESFASESVAPEDRIKELPDVRHSKTGAGARQRGQRARNLCFYFLFELTVEPRLPEYHMDGIHSRKIQVGTSRR